MSYTTRYNYLAKKLSNETSPALHNIFARLTRNLDVETLKVFINAFTAYNRACLYYEYKNPDGDAVRTSLRLLLEGLLTTAVNNALVHGLFEDAYHLALNLPDTAPLLVSRLNLGKLIHKKSAVVGGGIPIENNQYRPT